MKVNGVNAGSAKIGVLPSARTFGKKTKTVKKQEPDYGASVVYDKQNAIYTVSNSAKNVFDSQSWYYLDADGNAVFATVWTAPQKVSQSNELKKIYDEISQKTQKGKIKLSDIEAEEIYNNIKKAASN